VKTLADKWYTGTTGSHAHWHTWYFHEHVWKTIATGTYSSGIHYHQQQNTVTGAVDTTGGCPPRSWGTGGSRFRWTAPRGDWVDA